MPPARRFYAVLAPEWPSSSAIAFEETHTVFAFTSRRARDAWVHRPDVPEWDRPDDPPQTSRRAVSRREAAEVMRKILEGAHGGRQSGYAALREIGPEPAPSAHARNY